VESWPEPFGVERPKKLSRKNKLPLRIGLGVGATVVLFFTCCGVPTFLFNRAFKKAADQVEQVAKKNASVKSEEAAKYIRKELTPEAAREMADAFRDNPTRAQNDYYYVRWTLRLNVHRIALERYAIGPVQNGGYASIRMRSREEIMKLTAGNPTIIEASVSRFEPNTYEGVEFEDGVFISDEPIKKK
jgi:hypothetical protein